MIQILSAKNRKHSKVVANLKRKIHYEGGERYGK